MFLSGQTQDSFLKKYLKCYTYNTAPGTVSGAKQTLKKPLLNDQWHIFTNMIYGDLICTLYLYFPPGSVPIHKQMLHYFSLLIKKLKLPEDYWFVIDGLACFSVMIIKPGPQSALSVIPYLLTSAFWFGCNFTADTQRLT